MGHQIEVTPTVTVETRRESFYLYVAGVVGHDGEAPEFAYKDLEGLLVAFVEVKDSEAYRRWARQQR